jgi:acetylornithine deacetylase/succinyl-diaminopimelate desuccinylase-like protein
MDIRDTFLKLTTKTYPYGFESELIPLLGIDVEEDAFGNYFIEIGESNTLFNCHLDTVTDTQDNITHVFEEDFIKTDGTTILGADDKAGAVAMLYMIHNKVPGLYYFFIGEESGALGSKAVCGEYKFRKIKRVVSLDRRGISSIITHQQMIPCCSTEFALELSKQFAEHDLPLFLDNSGIYSDSFVFNDIVKNCTNISVGYYNEHTTEECLNITYLEKLCEVLCKIEWEKLID